jgi:predicted nucleic acid-binding protein
MKRYVEEKGTENVDVVYEAVERDEGQRLTFSLWNVGEVIGAMDERNRRGDIERAAMSRAVALFVGETRKFVAMRKLVVLPVGSRVLEESRDLVLKYHIYQADALQLASARQSASVLILTADRKLAECAESEKLQVANPEKDRRAIADALNE